MSFPRYPEYKDSGVEWLGVVPAHWTVTPLKWLTTRISSGKTPLGGNETYVNEGILFLRSQNVYDDGLRLDDVAYITSAVDASMAVSRVRAHDILLNITGASIGRTCVVPPNLPPANVNQHVCVVRIERADYIQFCGWFLKCDPVKQQIDFAQDGAAREGLTFEQIGGFCAALPKPDECALIAAFLDRETAKIDALVAEQETLIALLKEKRQAVISHAVTKGLNPDAPMKPSGIEWLGDVPAHWEVIALGRISIDKCDGPFGSGLKSEHYVDEGARVIRLQNIKGGYFDDRDAVFVDLTYFETEMAGHDVRCGDVLIAGLGDDKNTVGRACVAPIGIAPAMVKADCFRFRPDTDRVLAEFVAWALTTGSGFDAGVLSSGSTRSRIPLSVMASRKIALPPRSEQHEIVRVLAIRNQEFDLLIAEAEDAMDILKERRSALISAAVTGQIDVRGLVPASAA